MIKPEGVSVTWKWLAVAAVGLMSTLLLYDRLHAQTVLEEHARKLVELEVKIAVFPTQQDVKELRSSIESLRTFVEMQRKEK